MQNLQSKRFIIRQSLIGKNQVIEVTFKNGKQVTYNHDEVYEVMKTKLDTMNCFIKYKSYTSSTSVPTSVRELCHNVMTHCHFVGNHSTINKTNKQSFTYKQN